MTEDPALRIRAAGRADREFVRALSIEAFGRFGDYETTLPDLLGKSWVRTLVAEAESEPVGFAMLTIERLPRFEVDLVAIAVVEAWRARGVGRLLLEHAEGTARALARRRDVPRLRLTVALDNLPARGLFEAAGYDYVPEEQGLYPGGQVSIGMRRTLEREPQR